MSDRKSLRRALISVYNKVGLVEIGFALHEAGVELLSTGSTAKTLLAAGIPVTPVEEYTGFPEMLGGRVKTLHPRIHGGLLADQSDPDHLRQLAEHKIETFDLVVINLYPFTETIASGAEFAECIEQIDIGGPSMLRGAAKNHNSVAVISDPTQYPLLMSAIESGGFTQHQRQVLAMETYRKTAEYDVAIATWLAEQLESEKNWKGEIWKKSADLRYGENPHQSAALFQSSIAGTIGIASAKQLHGKEMSFNNFTDGDAAIRAAYDHAEPCVAIIKHANPCGIAIGTTIADAHRKAHECDSVSAFGGVIAANREVTLEMAEKVATIFTEVIIAPAFEAAAIELLSKKPNIRILLLSGYSVPTEELRPISGGLLIQTADQIDAPGDFAASWQQVAGEPVSHEILKDLEFAWRAVRAVKSNAILLAKSGASVGVGMGQVNRVDSAILAVRRAGERSIGSVAASDAFFPFADGLEILIAAGVSAVVQPGGSIRDEEVIAAAKASNVAMFFTGVRHFSHS